LFDQFGELRLRHLELPAEQPGVGVVSIHQPLTSIRHAPLRESNHSLPRRSRLPRLPRGLHPVERLRGVTRVGRGFFQRLLN